MEYNESDINEIIEEVTRATAKRLNDSSFSLTDAEVTAIKAYIDELVCEDIAELYALINWYVSVAVVSEEDVSCKEPDWNTILEEYGWEPDIFDSALYKIMYVLDEEVASVKNGNRRMLSVPEIMLMLDTVQAAESILGSYVFKYADKTSIYALYNSVKDYAWSLANTLLGK